ncbi:MAG: STAS domain-containing protein [bacterium]|nr:STAS domain-containing protein [bacterium]
MNPDFKIIVQEQDIVPILRIYGEIDIYTCPEFSTVLLDIIDKGNKDLILDLNNILYIDSTGLGAIAYSARIIAEKEGQINVICTKTQVKKIFEMSGLSKKNVKLFDKEDSAVKYFSSG